MSNQNDIDADLEKFLADGSPPSSAASSSSGDGLQENWRKSAERISRIQQSVEKNQRQAESTSPVRNEGSLVADILDVLHGGSSGSDGSAVASEEDEVLEDEGSEAGGDAVSRAGRFTTRSSSYGRARKNAVQRSADVIDSASVAFQEIVHLVLITIGILFTDHS